MSLFAVYTCQTLNMSQEELISPLNIKDELGGQRFSADTETGCGADPSHSTIIFVAAN